MQRATAFIALGLAVLLAAPSVTPAADKDTRRDDRSAGEKVRDKIESASEKLADDSKRERDPVRAAQRALKAKGYDPGDVDGNLGPKTREAVRAFQKHEGLRVTGRLDPETMARLRAGKSDDSPSAAPDAKDTKHK